MLNDGMLPFENTMLPEEAMSERMSGRPLPAPINASPEFAKIILKACAYDPKDRYKSISEMLEDVNKIKIDNTSTAANATATGNAAQNNTPVDSNKTVYAGATVIENAGQQSVTQNAGNTYNTATANNSVPANNQSYIRQGNNQSYIRQGNNNAYYGAAGYNNNRQQQNVYNNRQASKQNYNYSNFAIKDNINKLNNSKQKTPKLSITAFVFAILSMVCCIANLPGLIEYIQNGDISTNTPEEFTNVTIAILICALLSIIFSVLSFRNKVTVKKWMPLLSIVLSIVGFILFIICLPYALELL